MSWWQIMKKAVILQSNYIPWKGYFHLIQKADYFVFLDTAQYTKRDWRNRNKIKTPSGLKWLSVPNNGTQSKKINEVIIDNSTKWYEKHFQTLMNNYKNCKYLDDYYDFLQTVYIKTKWYNLSEMNQFLIKEISKFLGIETIFCNSSDFDLKDGKNEKIISILKQLQANHYITGTSAKSYIDISLFEAEGITVEFMNYPDYPTYKQPWGRFEHNVSVPDLLFCEGPNAANFIWNLK